MVEIGKFNTLKIVKDLDFGVYLDGGDGTEILLPARYVPHNVKPGDDIEVFIYRDNEERLIATTERPMATVGEFAFMEVKQVNDVGAFLDWGLMKDLFVPFREQKMKMVVGRKYWVYVYVDKDTDRIVASAKIDKFLDKYNPPYAEGDEVSIKIHSLCDLGTKVIVDDLYWGVIYENETFENLKIGETRIAFIKKIREDLKLDISLTKTGYRNRISDIETTIVAALEANNGFLALTDKSPAEEIKDCLGMSKKSFKMAIGGLYKMSKIKIEDSGIRLV